MTTFLCLTGLLTGPRFHPYRNYASCHGILDWLDGGSMDRASLSRESLEYMPHETIPIQYTDHLTAYTDILASGGYRCASQANGIWETA